MTQKTIENCFKIAGFKSEPVHPVDQEPLSTDDREIDDLPVTNAAEFLAVDEHAECRGGEMTDEEIIDVVSKRPRLEVEEESDEEEEDEATAAVTVTEAKRAVEILARFASVNGIDVNTLHKIDNISLELDRKSVQLMKQSKIDSFFPPQSHAL